MTTMAIGARKIGSAPRPRATGSMPAPMAQLDIRWMERHGLLAAGGSHRWQWGRGEVPAVEILVQVMAPGSPSSKGVSW
jgi:hypothetical protein